MATIVELALCDTAPQVCLKWEAEFTLLNTAFLLPMHFPCPVLHSSPACFPLFFIFTLNLT